MKSGKIKKVMCLLLSMCMIGATVGCGKKENGDKIILTVDFHGWAPTLNTEPTIDNPRVVRTPQLIADAFMEKYPDITIKWVRNKNVSGLEEEISQWFTTQIETGVCPTIAYSWGTKFQYNDWYVDLTDYLNQPNPYVEGNEKWADLFDDYLWKTSTLRGMDGNIYAIPVMLFSGAATGWFYNKTVLDNCGVTTAPTTWKQFMDAVSKVKNNFSGTALAPWSYFSKLEIDQWVMLASIGPAFANYIFEQTDYNGDGNVEQMEQIRATLQGLYSPVNHQYARDLYNELRNYYTNMLDKGWMSTDYYNSWDSGSVAMIEDGMWRMLDEKNKVGRDFEVGVFTSPLIGKDSYDYLKEIQYTEKGPHEPGVDMSLNIMKPAVEGKPEVLDAAVKFLQFLTQPEYISLYAEEWGSSLPATKSSTYGAQLNEWMNMSFPIVPDTQWPQAFVTEQNSRLNRVFSEWLNGRKTNAQFYTAVDEIQLAGANAIIERYEVDTSQW